MNVNFSNVNFAGYKSKFSQIFDEQLKKSQKKTSSDELLLQSLSIFCDRKTDSKRKIGSGYYSTVYKIDDKYVLKTDNHIKSHNISAIIFNRNLKFKNLKNYYGEAVATVVNKYGKNFSILKNVYKKGQTIPAGIPSDFAGKNSYSACIDYYKKIYLPRFSELPQKSFDNIAKDCAELNRMCKDGNAYTFDYLNPNNFLLTGKTIRIIDEIGQASQKDKKNSVSDLLSTFVSNFEPDYAEMYNPEIVEHRRIITKKLILAGAKENLPMVGSELDYAIWNNSFSTLDLEISDNSSAEIAKDIDKIIRITKNTIKRVEQVKQYLEINKIL